MGSVGVNSFILLYGIQKKPTILIFFLTEIYHWIFRAWTRWEPRRWDLAPLLQVICSIWLCGAIRQAHPQQHKQYRYGTFKLLTSRRRTIFKNAIPRRARRRLQDACAMPLHGIFIERCRLCGTFNPDIHCSIFERFLL